MFVMKIKMNEEKILREDVINLMKVYAYLDKLFTDNGLLIGAQEPDGTRVYYGRESGKDFGRCCIINQNLRIQDWFVPNCAKWLWGDNEENADVWEWEDVLKYYHENWGKS